MTSDHGGFFDFHGPQNEPCRKIPLIIGGDGVKTGRMPVDCEINHSHMDVFPSILDYLRIDVSPDMDLDGVSRI